MSGASALDLAIDAALMLIENSADGHPHSIRIANDLRAARENARLKETPADVICEQAGQWQKPRPSVSSFVTLRDHFAAQAPQVPDWFRVKDTGARQTRERFFDWRWYYADQMLKAREQ